MTTPEKARAEARQLVRDCQHRDEWICCWTCATAALARAAQGAPDELGKLLTCPWCGETQRDKIANAQISHLIECGDRLRAAQGAQPVGVVQSYSHWVDGQYVTKPYPTTPEPQARPPEDTR